MQQNAPQEAVAIARASIGKGVYWLGTGDCDTPATGRFDCFGFAFCFCYHVRRHRQGFNRGWRDPDGRTPSVEDDLNCNSAIEDADHRRELFTRVRRPQVGDLLAYPTFYLAGRPRPWIGHIAIVVDVSRVLEWDVTRPDWSLVDVVQCCGPDGRRPGIVATTGAHWSDHDRKWPLSKHRSALLRVAGAAAPARLVA